MKRRMLEVSMELSPRIRASDRERDQAVEQLREFHAEGRLDLGEFMDRMEIAQSATYRDQLAPLFADLPEPLPPPLPVPAPRRALRTFEALRTPLLVLGAVVLVVGLFVLTRGRILPLWGPLLLFWMFSGGGRSHCERDEDNDLHDEFH